MSSELEEFANRLSTAIAERFRAARHPYLSVAIIQQAIKAALDPHDVDQSYPRMVYRSTEQRMVGDITEEEAAQIEGYSRTPPPQFEAGFPCWRVERSTGQGGWKFPSADIRRVMLRTPAELRQFEAVTEAEDWLEDEVESPYGARGIALSDLVAERKALLKELVDAEPLEVAAEPVEEALVELPYETAAARGSSATLTGQDPDKEESQ